ncbi:DUF4395 domain-containing protein [Mucilaginibacter sp. AW1-3]
MDNTHLICPADRVTVDENRVRLTAFFVLLFAIGFLLTNWCLPVIFLLADFALRVFNLNAYSPLALASGFIVKRAGVKGKPTDRAPKRFAAIIGLVFVAGILIAWTFQLLHTSQVLTGVLIIFASLESFAGFCAGCYVYTLLKRIKVIS